MNIIHLQIFKLKLMEEINTGLYSSRVRKISFYSKFALPSGDFNTNLFTNLADGFTAGQNPDTKSKPRSTKSQWEQNAPIPLEMKSLLRSYLVILSNIRMILNQLVRLGTE